MNLFDWTAGIILAVLVVLAVRYSRKNTCSGHCESCGSACSRKNPGEEPDFVRRYRRDHPKSSQ